MKIRSLAAIAILLVLTFLLGAHQGDPHSSALAHAQSGDDLRVEALSIYVGQPRSPQEQDITISFRIVNAGTTTVGGTFPNTAYPRQSVSVFPGTVTGVILGTLYLTIPELSPGETVYMSRTITLPAGVNAFEARIEADVNHTLADIHPASNVATKYFENPFVLSPPPGQWFSIGPARMTAKRDDPHSADPIKEQQWYAAGRLTDVIVHPKNRDIIYVASPGADGWDGTGVWKTSNRGKTWQPITESLPTVTVAAMALDYSTDPERLYIATPDYGIFSSDDAGISWINVNSAVTGIRSNIRDGDLTVLLVDPTQPKVLYLTTRYGVERSEGYGKTWTPLLRLGSGAELWRPDSPSLHYDGEASALVMDPRNPNVLYAAIHNQGIYRTATGGLNLTTGAPDIGSWTRQNIGPADYNPENWILLGITHPITDRDETVYTLLESATIPKGHSLFRTTDGGRSWDQTPRWGCGFPGPEPPPESEIFDDKYQCNFSVMLVDPRDRNRVYFGGPILQIPVDPGSTQATGFARIPRIQSDADWQPTAPHGDYHGLAFDPTDSRILYAATDGGLYMSSRYGDDWTFIGDGITSAELYDIAIAPTDPNRVLAGTQDNGAILFNRSQDAGRVWEFCCGGDIALVAIDPNNEKTLYHGSFYQDELWQHLGRWTVQQCKLFAGCWGEDWFDHDCTHFGACWWDFNKGLPDVLPARIGCEAYYLKFHFQIHPTVPSTLYASCISLYRTSTSDPQRVQWEQIFTPPTGQVTRSAVDPIRNQLYAGTNEGKIFQRPALGSPQGPAVFRQQCCLVFEHPADYFLSDIEVDSNREIVYASFAPISGYDQDCSTYGSRVYKLARNTPGGPLVSEDITGNLPSGSSGTPANLGTTWLCVKALAIDLNLPRTLYAGTSKGVYRGRGNATTGAWVWEPYNNGIPPAYVRDLEIHPKTGHLFAATYGRGAFEVVPDNVVRILIAYQSNTSEKIIELKNMNELLVAILSSRTLDAPKELDRNSLRFGRTGAEASLSRCNKDAQDVNADGLPDVLCQFKTSLTGLGTGDTEVILKGKTQEGLSIEGSDTVTIIP